MKKVDSRDPDVHCALKTRLRRATALGLLLPTVGLVAACGSSSSSGSKGKSSTAATTSAEAKTSGKHIAVVVPTLEPGYYRAMACGAQQEGKKLGLEVGQVQGPTVAQNVAEESNVMRTALEAKPAGLIYTPAEGGAPGEDPIRSAVTSGLPVVNVDAQLEEPSLYVSYVGSSQTAGGKAGGELLAKQIGESGEVIALGIIPSNPITKGRIDGFLEAMKKYPKIKVVAIKYPQADVSAIAAEATALMTSHPNIKGFYTTNSSTVGPGVAEAVRSANKTGKVKVVTWDLEAAGIKLLKEGTITGTVAQKPHEIGEIAVEQLQKKFEGKTTTKTIDVPFVTVTSETIDTPASKAMYYTATCE